MRCPFCGEDEDRVLDSRVVEDGQSIRRRRECVRCRRRITTYERRERVPMMVVKKDGRRQPFDRDRILVGIQKACEKRPVASARMDEIAAEAERQAYDRWDREIPSTAIGEMVMERLHSVDEVAYVRFASVYRQFRDIGDFIDEVKRLLE